MGWLPSPCCASRCRCRGYCNLRLPYWSLPTSVSSPVSLPLSVGECTRASNRRMHTYRAIVLTKSEATRAARTATNLAVRRRAWLELKGSALQAPKHHMLPAAEGGHATNLAMGAGRDTTSEESSDFIVSAITGASAHLRLRLYLAHSVSIHTHVHICTHVYVCIHAQLHMRTHS